MSRGWPCCGLPRPASAVRTRSPGRPWSGSRSRLWCPRSCAWPSPPSMNSLAIWPTLPGSWPWARRMNVPMRCAPRCWCARRTRRRWRCCTGNSSSAPMPPIRPGGCCWASLPSTWSGRPMRWSGIAACPAASSARSRGCASPRCCSTWATAKRRSPNCGRCSRTPAWRRSCAAMPTSWRPNCGARPGMPTASSTPTPAAWRPGPTRARSSTPGP